MKLLISGIAIVLLAGGLALRFYPLPGYRDKREVRVAAPKNYHNGSLGTRQAQEKSLAIEAQHAL